MKYLSIVLLFVVTAGFSQDLKKQIQKEKVIFCAHRGGMYPDHAENSIRTVEFLLKSMAPNSVMVEIDVRKSKDGTYWLLHDETLERTTNGHGRIEDATDEYLKLINLKNGNGEETDEFIPTLRQFLEFIYKKNVFVMLDVKVDTDKDWNEILLNIVKFKQATEKCLVLTFKPGNSKKVHTVSPQILVSCLVRDRNDWNEISKIVPKEVMLAYINKNTPDDVVKEMKQQNIMLVTDASEATTNGSKLYPKEFYKGVIDRGVNVYVTDLPVEVNKLLKK